MQMNKKKLTVYLICTFGVAWVLQVIASLFAMKGNNLAFTLLLTVCMYAPLLGTIVAGIPLRGMGFVPHLKGKIKYVILSWLAPVVFTVLGAALYYLIFPKHFDLTGMYLMQAGGEEMAALLASQSIPVWIYLLSSAFSAVLYAPWINMLAALGEEIGWRGALNPMLKAHFGNTKGRLIGGVIWGAWHWPVMILAGYEYGTGYFGEPVLGMVMFCLFTVSAGTMLDFCYEKSKCIWIPALGHGAINAVCSLPLLFANTEQSIELTIGPMPIGLISMIPMIVVACVILKKDK